jgi:hypothetical membrane protein
MASDGRLGPLVHRAVHHGAALWLIGSLQFIAAMIVVQLGWRSPPSYSLTRNYISDLGNTGCGPWPNASSHIVCSPWHTVFSGSVIVLGLLFILGALLVPTAFPARKSRTIGLGLLLVAGIGSIGVGLSPENVNLTIHTISALLAFGGANLGLLVLGFGMLRDTRWDGYRAYTLISGLVGFVALLLFSFHIDAGLGVGGMERLVAAPGLLWLIVAGVHLLRVPTYAPTGLPKGG